MLIRRIVKLTLAAVVLCVCALPLPTAASAAVGRTCTWLDDDTVICTAATDGDTTKASTAAAVPTTSKQSIGAGAGGFKEAGGPGGGVETPNINLGECAWDTVTPAPPAGDARWEGNDPATGSVLMNVCGGTLRYMFVAAQAAAAPPPDPADLAQQAFTLLTLPKPTLGRSPSLQNGDPAQGGQAYTIVNLWTWFYTDPATFVPMSRTVSLQGVSATVTATPKALVFSPGDGHAAVSCAGPGRPWESADQFDAPDAGGCGYRYTEVQAEPITGTVSISWDVSWTGTGGVSGVFDGVATSSSSQFIVQQIRTVVVR
jgi:hypothetical protein